MSELADAKDRLEQAITRLEHALQSRGGGTDLEQALAEARAETKRLREAADTVSGRLDAAIGRLKTALDAGA